MVEDERYLASGTASRCDLRYGRRPRETLDYFPGKSKDAPLFVFIHGGYWQRNEKERFSFTALGALAHGINVAVPGYTLAPEARLTDIVAEIRASLTFLVERARDLGFDRDKIFVGGLVGGWTPHRHRGRPSGGTRRDSDQRYFRS